MKAVAVIPARFASTRFPGKPLARETGKYMIQHVYEGVAACRALNRVIVATDDERIAEAVRSFGGEPRMTRSDHVSGTDRVAEVAAGLDLSDDDLVLNVQGDEPDLHPSVLDRLVAYFHGGERGQVGRAELCRIGTIASPFPASPKEGPGSPLDPNRVKVVFDRAGRALYFSRSLIPYPRSTAGRVEQPAKWWLHLGVYAFRADTLRALTGGEGLPVGELESAESLEQLRWLQAGHAIAVVPVDHAFTGVDTPDDYRAFVSRWKSKPRS